MTLTKIEMKSAPGQTFTLTAGVAKTAFDRFISQLTQPAFA